MEGREAGKGGREGREDQIKSNQIKSNVFMEHAVLGKIVFHKVNNQQKLT